MTISDDIEGAVLSQIIDQIRKMYDYILINTSSFVSEGTVNAFSLSDLVLLVGVQQVTVIRSMRNFLALYTEIGLDKEKLMLILNRMDESNSITPRKISEMLNLQVVHSIPFDKRTAEKAANLGIPFVLENRRIEISKSIFALTDLVRSRVAKKE
jgi:pilus assembly protein CpaE